MGKIFLGPKRGSGSLCKAPGGAIRSDACCADHPKGKGKKTIRRAPAALLEPSAAGSGAARTGDAGASSICGGHLPAGEDGAATQQQQQHFCRSRAQMRRQGQVQGRLRRPSEGQGQEDRGPQMTCDGIGPGFSRVPSSLAHAGSAERFFGAVGRNARAWLRLAPPSPCDHLLAAICVPGFTELRIRN